jgi:hypothetical protein
MRVQDVFDFLNDGDNSKINSLDEMFDNEELEKSLNEYGYNPKKFDFITIKEIVGLGFRVTRGRKRVKILNRKNPEQLIQVLHLKPFYPRNK